MLLNYLKVGLRNILKHKSFSFINLFGLAAAMSVCMLIIMVIADQKGYDRWQINKDRVYRIQTIGKNGNRMRATATSALPLGATLRKDYMGIEAAASLVRSIGGDLLYKDKIASGGGYFADDKLFRVMDFHLQQGDARTALEKPFSMVISEDLAAQLFHNEDPIGKTIRFNNTGLLPGGPESGNIETTYGQFLITGVLKSNPGKTTLPFKLLASLSSMPALARDTLLSYEPNDWNGVWNTYTFVLMEKGRSKADLQRILDKISARQYPKGHDNQFAYEAAALTDLMPADVIGNPTNISMPRFILLILSVLCLVVMLSACLNYTNLSIARMLTRTKEVGIRKVSGATRRQIFTQFISEAILMSLLSLLLSLLILLLFQRLFSGLWLNQYLNITFRYTPTLFLIFLMFSVAVGFLAGLLPAVYISLFNPVNVLKGLNNISFFKRLTLRKVLLAVQFCVSLIFIISTSLIYLQGKHVLNFDYGFKKENVVNIKLYKLENYNRFAQAIATSRDIGAVSACSYLPATETNMSQMVHKAANPTDSLQANYIDIDAGCLQVWGLQLVAGRNLPPISADSNDRYVLINEKMAADLKYSPAKGGVGQHLLLGGKDAEIVGVVKDFQFLDVSRAMEPLMLRNRRSEFGYATVRLQGKDLPGAVAFLQNTWKKVNPSSKFEFQFFDQQVLTTHSMMSDTAGVLGVLAFLAVIISCLGLLGMATYTAETRRKEISVRKVLGASVPGVIFLLSRGYMILLTISILIAVPLACILNNIWLQFFASRISITPWILLVNISILLVISFSIVFSQAWKVSMANPASHLRAE